MRIIKLTLALLLASGALLPAVRAAEAVSVRAILIMASNAKGAADPRLAPFEATLQRNVPESSFRYVAEGSASVPGSGTATISLGNGYSVELQGRGSPQLAVTWKQGNRTMVPTQELQRGGTALLGRRPSTDGEVPIVLVIAK
jgi:hypothetical protein